VLVLGLLLALAIKVVDQRLRATSR
jgi:hypothetical protein